MIPCADRRNQLIRQFDDMSDGLLNLGKDTSNLFRHRHGASIKRPDARHFDHVLDVQPEFVEAVGMTPYVTLVASTLAQGAMPAVVPQLMSITLGGALAGVVIEATSFRHGLVHETILEFDVLTGTGEVVTCAPDNLHRSIMAFPTQQTN